MVQTTRTSRSHSPSLLAAGVVTPEGLSDGELLSELLGQPLARSLHLLESAGGVARLREPRIGQLIARGWPPKAAARVLAARELNRRAERGSRDARTRCIATPSEVYSWAQARLASLEREELWVLALNARNHLLAARVVAVGGSSGVRTTTGDVLRTALGEGASAFVLVHNHPSGDPTPSDEDLRFTEKIESAARACDVPLLDHVVVTEGGFSSALRSP